MLTPEEIEQTQFTVVRLTEAGYRQQEVDDFLERVQHDYALALNDAAQMQTALEASRRGVREANLKSSAVADSLAAAVTMTLPPVPAASVVVSNNGPSLESIGLLLTTAEDAVKKMRADAEAYAAKVREDANNEAAGIKAELTAKAQELNAAAKAEGARLLAEARTEADNVKSAATAQKHTIIGELESKRAELEAKVADLVGKHGSIVQVLEEVLNAAKGSTK